jgi:hypothetical protein
VLLRHTLRNALIPILTICGESFASLVTGTIVIESVFGIPGVGSLIVDSIERRDVTVIQGVVLLITVCYVLVNLAVDLLSYLADPRLSVEGKAADDEQKPRNLDLAALLLAIVLLSFLPAPSAPTTLTALTRSAA